MNLADTRSKKTSSQQAVAFLILTTACWGISFPLIRALMLELGQVWPEASDWFLASLLMVVRFGAAAILMGILGIHRWKELTWLEVKLGVGLGLFGGGGILFQMTGLGHTLASTSAFLTQFYVVLLPIIAAVSQRTFPSSRLTLSCLMVIIGMGILCDIEWNHFQLGVGELQTLLASTILVGNILWLDRREFVGTNKLRATVIMFATITLMFLPMIFLTRPQIGSMSSLYFLPSLRITLPVLVIVCTIGAYTLMNLWQPFVSPSHAGIIYCSEPLFASFFALFLPQFLAELGSIPYPNESFTKNLCIGGALITLANLLMATAKTPPQKGEAQVHR